MDAQEIKQLKELQDAYLSVYEAKKVDQDEDGDNDFADIRVARMVASGMSKAEAIAAVKNKEYNEGYKPWDFGPKDKAKAKYDKLAKRKAAGGSAPGTATRANKIASVGREMRTTLDKDSAMTMTDPKKQGLQPSTQRHTLAAIRGAGGGTTARTKFRKEEFELWVNDLLDEGYDLFDYMMEYLLDEGYANTQESALVIMANMSEDWRESIVEAPYTGRPVGREAMLSNNISRARSSTPTTPTPTPTPTTTPTTTPITQTTPRPTPTQTTPRPTPTQTTPRPTPTQTTPRPTPTQTTPRPTPYSTRPVAPPAAQPAMPRTLVPQRREDPAAPAAGSSQYKLPKTWEERRERRREIMKNYNSSNADQTTPRPTPYSTRPGDGKPYKEGPLWDSGSATPKPPVRNSNPPMRNQPLF